MGDPTDAKPQRKNPIGMSRPTRDKIRGQMSVLDYWRSKDLERRAQSSPDLKRNKKTDQECLEPGELITQAKEMETPGVKSDHSVVEYPNP